MSKQIYRDHHVVVTRDIYSGMHSVKYWPVNGNEEEDCVRAGGYVSGVLALNLAKDRIDEHYEDLAHLESQRS